jgi:type II secretory pathway predicted ATPase ExeA
VLIVDEAQNLGVQGLEEVRMLSNVNAQKSYLLHTILVGQPELRDLIKKPELRQLTQRVSVAYHLRSLTREETEAYIRHRLQVAGGDPDLFLPEAIDRVFEASTGVPRLINTLCDLALVYGFSEGKPRIDTAVMDAVQEDRGMMGLPGGSEAPIESLAAIPPR